MRNIIEIRDALGIAILLIEHDMKLVMGICRRHRRFDTAGSSPKAQPKKFRPTTKSSRPTWEKKEA